MRNVLIVAMVASAACAFLYWTSRDRDFWPTIHPVPSESNTVYAGEKLEITRELRVPPGKDFYLIGSQTDCGCTSLSMGGLLLESPVPLTTGSHLLQITVDTSLKQGKSAFGYFLVASDGFTESRIFDRFLIDITPSIRVFPNGFAAEIGDEVVVNVESGFDLSLLKTRASHPDMLKVSGIVAHGYNKPDGIWSGEFKIKVIGNLPADMFSCWVETIPPASGADGSKVYVHIASDRTFKVSPKRLWIDSAGSFPIEKQAHVYTNSASDVVASIPGSIPLANAISERVGNSTWRIIVRVLNPECESFLLNLEQDGVIETMSVTIE